MDIQSIMSGLELQRNRINRVITALEGLSSISAPRRGRPPKSQPSSQSSLRKKTMSAAARAKISAAQKARWAKQRKDIGPKRVRANRGITPAGRRRLSAMMKARWAEWHKKAKAA